MTEWSLILFTLLVQSAAGLVIVSEVARFAAGKGKADALFTWTAPTAALLAAGGMLVSMAHLGTPTHCIFTVTNVGNSWLSREILASGVFFGLLLALSMMRAKGVGTGVLAALTAVAGFCAVFMMARVYQLHTVPVWNSGATDLNFFGTMFLMGAVSGGLLLGMQMQSCGDEASPWRNRLFGIVAAAGALGLALQFIGIPLSMLSGNAVNEHGISALNSLIAQGTGIFVLRVLLAVAGAALFGWAVIRAISKKIDGSMIAVAFCSLACVTTGELLGRLLFYTSYTRIGL